MGRAERRREKKQMTKAQKAASKVLTQYELGYAEGIKAGRAAAIFEMSGQCCRTFTTAFVAIYRTEDKFGATRIKRRLNMLYAQLEDMLNGVVSEEKIRKWIKKDTGIDLDEFTGARRLDLMKEVREEYQNLIDGCQDMIVGMPVRKEGDFVDIQRKA